MSLRLLVVDDEAPARQRLRLVLQDVRAQCPNTLAGEAASANEALLLLSTRPVDVLLLDIHMPDIDGIELARHLLGLPQPPAVIFTTAYDDHALQAFEVQALDYLLKPVRAERLVAALHKARRLGPADAGRLAAVHGGARRFLSAHEHGRVVLVPLEQVLYLRAELKYVTVVTATRAYMIEESLTQLEQEFATRLVRIHRSVLVARQAIRGFVRQVPPGGGEAQWLVELADCPAPLPVSRRQAQLVQRFLQGGLEAI
jgi:two-component system response regulator AlgR